MIFLVHLGFGFGVGVSFAISVDDEDLNTCIHLRKRTRGRISCHDRYLNEGLGRISWRSRGGERPLFWISNQNIPVLRQWLHVLCRSPCLRPVERAFRLRDSKDPEKCRLGPEHVLGFIKEQKQNLKYWRTNFTLLKYILQCWHLDSIQLKYDVNSEVNGRGNIYIYILGKRGVDSTPKMKINLNRMTIILEFTPFNISILLQSVLFQPPAATYPWASKDLIWLESGINGVVERIPLLHITHPEAAFHCKASLFVSLVQTLNYTFLMHVIIFRVFVRRSTRSFSAMRIVKI